MKFDRLASLEAFSFLINSKLSPKFKVSKVRARKGDPRRALDSPLLGIISLQGV
jgi:hypothetical protein